MLFQEFLHSNLAILERTLYSTITISQNIKCIPAKTQIWCFEYHYSSSMLQFLTKTQPLDQDLTSIYIQLLEYNM